MGKKRKTQLFVLKPWCWYCEREFEDEKVLLQHQKSKHFKCQLCPRKLNTAGGLMVHSQQVHKCEPEPLTNTLPGRDGYDIEIFGMEGIPTNALAEWKARKEAEAGTAALASAAAGKRPRHSYVVIPEADLMAALQQHKALMAARRNPVTNINLPPFPPNGAAPPFMPGMPPPGFAGMPPMPPPTLPPQGFMGQPPMPSFPPPGVSPVPPATISPLRNTPTTPGPPPKFVASTSDATGIMNVSEPIIEPPKNGVMWPDVTASPAEKRAQLSRYRYSSPSADGAGANGLENKRKAAADFL